MSQDVTETAPGCSRLVVIYSRFRNVQSSRCNVGIVEALGLENDNVEIYDLNGRKLSSYQNGINIVNGKKVFK